MLFHFFFGQLWVLLFDGLINGPVFLDSQKCPVLITDMILFEIGDDSGSYYQHQRVYGTVTTGPGNGASVAIRWEAAPVANSNTIYWMLGTESTRCMVISPGGRRTTVLHRKQS